MAALTLAKESVYQRWAQIRSPATFFKSRAGSGFEFLRKSQIRIQYEWYDVYRMYVKAWQRWHRVRSGARFRV